jgi:hypothetical protein
MAFMRLSRGTVAVGNIKITGGAVDGGGLMRVTRATFDPSANTAQRPVGVYTLSYPTNETIPSGAVIVGGFMRVITLFTSAGGNTGTIAISIEAANDISTAAAVSGAPWSTTGLKAITPKANTPESTGILLTAARKVTATVAVQALTAGKAYVYLYWVA